MKTPIRTEKIQHFVVNMNDIIKLAYREFGKMSKTHEKSRISYVNSHVHVVDAPKNENDLSEYRKRVSNLQ